MIRNFKILAVAAFISGLAWADVDPSTMRQSQPQSQPMRASEQFLDAIPQGCPYGTDSVCCASDGYYCTATCCMPNGQRPWAQPINMSSLSSNDMSCSS